MGLLKYYHGIDVGTTKTSSTIVEWDGEGLPLVIGFASVPTLGLRNSLVIDMERTTVAIRTATEKSQKMAGVQVNSAYVGIAGDHIKSSDNRGMVSIARERSSTGKSSAITQSDKDRVLDDARGIAMPMDKQILHVIEQGYKVDDQTGITEPIGLSCRRLEVDVHIITGSVTAIRNLERCVRNAGLQVRELVLESIASGHAVLTQDEMDQGVVLIDIGGGTCDVSMYWDGSLRFIDEFRYAGVAVTKDIANMFNIPSQTAENVKINHGTVISPNGNRELIPVEMYEAGDTRYVHPADLYNVVNARMYEIFEILRRRLQRFEHYDRICGIVLTGGGSLLTGAKLLAERVFEIPARIGVPKGFSGMEETLRTPVCATAVGIIKYAIANESRRSHAENIEFTFHNVLNKIRLAANWLIN